MNERCIETLAQGFGLLEGPVWDSRRGLLFADAECGGVHCLGAAGDMRVVVPHRRGIGGMVLHEDGGLVVSGRNIAYKAPADQPTLVLLENDPAGGTVGFNDITTDGAGRIYAGSLGFYPTKKGDTPRPGALYVIDLDGTVRRVVDGIQLTNGLGFSPDERLLYHSDSGDQIVYAYDVLRGGEVGNRRPFAMIPEGLPDGIATARDGSVWVAVAHGGIVVVLEPDGTVRERIAFPLPMVTSLCFGGDDLRTLYVVSGSEGAAGDRAGAVFNLRSDVPGLPIAPARVQVRRS